METIKKIYLRNLTNGEHNLFVTSVLNQAEADEKISVRCRDLLDAFRAALDREDTDLRISRKSLFTDEIVETNRECEGYYTTYKKTVREILRTHRHPNEAKRLSQHLKDYGITTRMRMLKEVGLLMNFIEDLQEKFAEDVATLSLEKLVENMKKTNDRVRALLESRSDERAGIPPAALRNSRLGTDEAYHRLVRKINSLAEFESEADYTPFIQHVNDEIKRFKQSATNKVKTAERMEPYTLSETDETEGREEADGPDATEAM